MTTFLDNSSLVTGCANSWVVPGTLTTQKIKLPNAPAFTGSLSTLQNDAGFLVSNGAGNVYTGNGQVVSFGNVNLPGTTTLNLGSDQTKAPNAGTLAYQSLTPGAVDLVGAGTTVGARNVKLWDNVTVPGTVQAAGVVAGGVTANGISSNTVVAPGLGFQDSSMYNNPTPVVGSVQVSSLTPYTNQPGYGSLYFPGGVQNYVAYASTTPAVFDWSASNSTFECYLNLPTLPASNNSICLFGVGAPLPASTNWWSLNINNTGTVSAYAYSSAGLGSYLYSNSTITANVWTHLAVQYNKATTTQSMYVNGILTNSISFPGLNTGFSSSQFVINGLAPWPPSATTNAVASSVNYLTDLRLTRGQLVYTGNTFTVPTAPLTASSNTQLLLRTTTGTHGSLQTGQLLCGANTIVDVSQNNYNPTPSSGSVTASDLSPYPNQNAYGSVLLTNNAFVQYSGNTCLNLTPVNIASQDFTAECWVYPTTIPSNTWNIFGRGNNWQLNVASNGRPQFYYFNNTTNTSTYITAKTSIIANTWSHLGISSTASPAAVTLLFNGTAVSSSVGAVQYSSTYPGGDIFVASNSGYNTASFAMSNPSMYVTDLRMQAGLASYSNSSTYSIPTQALPTTANTQLLLRSQRAVTVTDNLGAGGSQMTIAGNVQIAGKMSVSGPVSGSNLDQFYYKVAGTTPLGYSCYNTPGGGTLIVSCSNNYAGGSAVYSAVYMIMQYLDSSTTWASSTATVVLIAGSGQWSFTNVNGQLQITCPAGNNLIRISKNY